MKLFTFVAVALFLAGPVSAQTAGGSTGGNNAQGPKSGVAQRPKQAQQVCRCSCVAGSSHQTFDTARTCSSLSLEGKQCPTAQGTWGYVQGCQDVVVVSKPNTPPTAPRPGPAKAGH
jgi:hypothetical protein